MPWEKKSFFHISGASDGPTKNFHIPELMLSCKPWRRAAIAANVEAFHSLKFIST